MQDETATLEDGGADAVDPNDGLSRPSQAPRSPVMKFAYPSGSQPLPGYTIKRGVGRGGFGEVYFATSDAGKEVALKHIQRNLDIELRGVRQCLNLKHPNLVALFDIRYDEEETGWVVMEYISGESLKDILERHPDGMPEEEVRRWLTGMTAGVACLHDHGIVHRDIKPGNLFEDEGIVKVGDYGLSKFISVSRRSGQTESVGTFHYMAPEIGRGKYGREIDVYALGIVLHEMLTGRVPFDGETSQEIIMKHLTADPDLSCIRPPYREAIQGALIKDPDLRIGSVDEFLYRMGMASAAIGGGPVDFQVRREKTEPDADVIDAEPVETPQTQTAGWHNPERGEGRGKARRGGASDDINYRQDPAPGKPVEEPVAKAIKDAWTNTHCWWRRVELNTFAKIVLLTTVGVIAMLVFSASWFLWVALAVCYAVYALIWAIVHQSNAPAHANPHEPKPPPVASPPPPSWHSPKAYSRSYTRRRLREVLVATPAKQRLARLTGGMLMAAFTSAVFCVVVFALSGQSASSAALGGLPYYAWLMINTTLASWAVMIAAVCWEDRADSLSHREVGASGEQVYRRFTMLVIGLVLGLIAFATAKLLLIEFVDLGPARMARGDNFAGDLYDVAGQPLLPAFLAMFGSLFLVLRWWRQADALRNTRLSVGATTICVIWALILDGILGFPHLNIVLYAAVVSLCVQLSAWWMTPEHRSNARFQLADSEARVP
jgi:serine/threonine protein kinase